MKKQDEARQIMNDEIKSHSDTAMRFEELYSQYKKNRFSTTFAYGRSKIHDLLLDTAKKLPASARILDVGCGTGEQISLLRKHGYAVYGLEPAEKMRTIAKERNSDTDILDSNALNLPFEDNIFDMVLAVEVLRYLHPRHQEESLDEIHRILKPGGVFFATLVSKYSLDDLTYYHFKRLKSRLWHSPPLYNHFTTPTLYIQLLSRHQFDDAQWYGRMFTPLRIAYILNQRIGEFLAPKFEKLEDHILKNKSISLFCGNIIVITRARKTKAPGCANLGICSSSPTLVPSLKTKRVSERPSSSIVRLKHIAFHRKSQTSIAKVKKRCAECACKRNTPSMPSWASPYIGRILNADCSN